MENIISGLGIERTAQEFIYQGERKVTAKEVFAAAERGEINACKIIDRASQALVYALKGLIYLLDPQMIIFGGTIALSNPGFIEKIKRDLTGYRVDAKELEITLTRLGNRAVLYGAVVLGYQALKNEET